MTSKQSRTKTKNHTVKATAKKPALPKPAMKAKPGKPVPKTIKPAKPAVVEKVALELKKSRGFNTIEENPRLLRETKGTTAALNLLEKAIKLIYHKELKKARTELRLLLETHPSEPEILARARSYIQICDREEVAHKKPAVGNDQLYTLGVMEHNKGDYDKAIHFFRLSLEKNPNSDHIHYSLAATLAVKGDAAEAIRHLEKAVELNEENRVYAKNDSDFSLLHGKKEFSDLVGWSQPAVGG
jgi:tetratricopeptide (TPR) repeat protein